MNLKNVDEISKTCESQEDKTWQDHQLEQQLLLR